MEEIWIDIKGWEGYYQISNFQRVKSLERVIIYPKGGRKTIKEKILKDNIGESGYIYYGFSRNQNIKVHKLHILLATYFIPNPNNYPIVRHLNDNKLDNRLENLAWGTSMDNARDRGNNGKTLRGEKHPNFGKAFREQDGEKNSMYGRKGEKHHSFGKRGDLCKYRGSQHYKSKIVLDLQTGIYYPCVREAAEARGLKNNTLRNRLNGNLVNNTSLIYA